MVGRLTALLWCVTLTACATTSEPDPATFDSAQSVPQGAEATPEARQSVVEGNTAFSLDLYHWLLEDMRERPDQYDGPNLFYSPASISTALAMVYAGARGETADQMAETMHFEIVPEQFHPAAGALLSEMQIDEDGREVSVANSLWVQEGLRLEEPFVDITSRFYAAGVNRVDYIEEGPREDARQTINRWVEERTNERIRELIPRVPAFLSDETRLVLVNAVYLNADWVSQFDDEDTQRAPFTALSGADVVVDMMQISEDFRYLEGDGWKAAQLPYQGDELSMAVFLPDERDGLAAFERQLDTERLSGWLADLEAAPERPLQLRFPKFRQTQRFSLGTALGDLGMRLAFDRRRADLFGISTDMPADRRLALSGVVHQSFIEVDEEGTEAAAATAGGGVIVVTGQMPTEFHADHPFFYVIRDNRSGMILFMGRMAEPEAPPAEDG